MRKYEVLIFLTGAVTLALEVLASRIMTPYFGVSLYIWAGILSITLTFLAVGYGMGGRRSLNRSPRELETGCLAAPLLSAAAIVAAAAVFPFLFPALSRIDLITGSFIGATVLLALPLIALSAMNPLLIGLQRTARARGDSSGDAGAGRVFFISTVGSVAGVLATAFLFIPNVTNFRSILLLAMLLCALTAGYTLSSDAVAKGARRALILGCAAVAAAAAVLFIGRDGYLKLVASGPDTGTIFEKEAEYSSVFGNIKVIKLQAADGAAPAQRLFVQDGLVQNRASLDHTSVSLYTYALWALSLAAAPKAERALVLGLGAGIVPRHLREHGVRVDVVDINSDVLEAATAHFGFDPSGIDIRIADARTFVRGCAAQYDVLVVDLFLGDNVPDYLLTREFFTDAAGCLAKDGSLVMNVFFDEAGDEPNRRLLATVRSAFPQVIEYTIPSGNHLIVATSAATRLAGVDVLLAAMPARLGGFVRALLGAARPVTPARVADTEPVGDDLNIFSVLFAEANMRERQSMAGQLPPWLLVN